MTVTIHGCKFKITNTRHVEMSRKTKRRKCKHQKVTTSAKNKDLLMVCKKWLISKQYHAFFDSLRVATSGEKKDGIDYNSESERGENKSSDTH